MPAGGLGDSMGGMSGGGGVGDVKGSELECVWLWALGGGCGKGRGGGGVHNVEPVPRDLVKLHTVLAVPFHGMCFSFFFNSSFHGSLTFR